jgi:hypothetical protein
MKTVDQGGNYKFAQLLSMVREQRWVDLSSLCLLDCYTLFSGRKT